MTMAVLVLVCAATLAPPACDESNARAVMRLRDAPGPVACGLLGQTLPAETVTVGPDEYVKVVCRPGR